jgi:hypothetical protein
VDCDVKAQFAFLSSARLAADGPPISQPSSVSSAGASFPTWGGPEMLPDGTGVAAFCVEQIGRQT